MLAAFLRSAAMRKLQGAERRAAIRALFEEVERIEQVNPFDSETKPSRIMVMWRLCRTSALVKGLCSEDETLDAATEVDPNPWVNPFMPVITPTMGSALRRQRASRLLEYHAERPGLPLLPPRNDQDALARWCNAAALVAADLGIERSREGLQGLQGLLDPLQCRHCDVTSAEVLAFEEMLLSETLDMLLDKGERTAIKHFKSEYGFAHKEALNVMRVVRAQALERASGTIEEKRALAEMRLEDQLGRYKETMDMDGEMKAIKELAKIQGLTRTEPDDQNQQFFEVVRTVSYRQDRELLDPETLRLLDGNRAEEVEAVVIEPVPDDTDPEDAAALAEYDSENQLR